MTLRTITFDDEQWQVVPREAFDRAMRNTWNMIDPVRPVGDTGSYWRGQENGIAAALRTLRENYEAELSRAAPEPPDMDAVWLSHMPNEDERKWEQIEAWARASYRSHRSAIRGQIVTRADAYEHHVACAALKWARENPEPPAQQPMTEEQILSEIPGIGWDDTVDEVLPVVRAVEAFHGIGKGVDIPPAL